MYQANFPQILKEKLKKPIVQTHFWLLYAGKSPHKKAKLGLVGLASAHFLAQTLWSKNAKLGPVAPFNWCNFKPPNAMETYVDYLKS